MAKGRWESTPLMEATRGEIVLTATADGVQLWMRGMDAVEVLRGDRKR